MSKPVFSISLVGFEMVAWKTGTRLPLNQLWCINMARQWNFFCYYFVSKCRQVRIDCDKSQKIANFLSSTCTEMISAHCL